MSQLYVSLASFLQITGFPEGAGQGPPDVKHPDCSIPTPTLPTLNVLTFTVIATVAPTIDSWGQVLKHICAARPEPPVSGLSLDAEGGAVAGALGHEKAKSSGGGHDGAGGQPQNGYPGAGAQKIVYANHFEGEPLGEEPAAWKAWQTAKGENLEIFVPLDFTDDHGNQKFVYYQVDYNGRAIKLDDYNGRAIKLDDYNGRAIKLDDYNGRAIELDDYNGRAIKLDRHSPDSGVRAVDDYFVYALVADANVTEASATFYQPIRCNEAKEYNMQARLLWVNAAFKAASCAIKASWSGFEERGLTAQPVEDVTIILDFTTTWDPEDENFVIELSCSGIREAGNRFRWQTYFFAS
ncbi:unnamed protein product [Parascedosporium putredinis]|uniref:Uncharacterized protein n=1 Tax=Parascedosporium putredinis TaxID=1442378 RepID=A0A9P1MG92_9PEZI|nr:unnamed protein product [Parascedosporium putredinis]CAI8004994.1 unnamed protein product [Parascedosporium putredinis]